MWQSDLEPIYQTRALTAWEEEITVKLYDLLMKVYTGEEYIARQVKDAQTKRGKQNICLFSGNEIHRMFFEVVEEAKKRGELPPELRGTKNFVKGPDVTMAKVAWEVTQATNARSKIGRDIAPDPGKWDAYIVLGY